MEPAKILVVDDESAILRLLREALTQWGYQVTSASSAAEALQALRGDMFDAVITDIRMPDMNGLELLKEIKRHDESVEVVVMTGDRKSTRLNSSHGYISYAVFCLKKKKKNKDNNYNISK